MKYTKKQIESAFVKWNTELRKDPEEFITDEDYNSIDVTELSKDQTLDLIKYMK